MTDSTSPSRLRPVLMATLLAAGAGAGAGAGGVALADNPPAKPQVAIPTGIAPVGGTRPGPTSLADMVEAVGPSVVQIQVMKKGAVRARALPFGGDDDMNDQLRRFFGFGFGPDRSAPRRQPIQRALGSGFIIDRTGIVLTNNHVVDGANEVKVQLSDGREFSGTVLGSDPKTDIAVVRIKGGADFKAIRWGDSDHVRVGDSVFAVGSPFGFGNTVTSGIISARSRDIGQGAYDDFLQVDAAINSGNSGGPLFDASGHVIGINTAIFSPSGGNVGIGFAIPEVMARNVAEQIVAHGRVSRGHIGVGLQRMTPAIAEAMGLKSDAGALIANVERGGPAFASGLRQGDVVRRFDGKVVEDTRTFARLVADAKAGTRVPVLVVRDGRQVALKLSIGQDQRDS